MCSSLYVKEAVAGNGLHRQGTADCWFCNELFQNNEYLRPLDLSEIEVLGGLSSEPCRWLGILFFCRLLTDRRKRVYVGLHWCPGRTWNVDWQSSRREEGKVEMANPWGLLLLARATACWCCFAVVNLKDCLETRLEQFRG